MDERVYNRVANVLMLIGIASALVFDSGKFPRAVVGTIGIVAGVAAMVLYFWNQHKIQAKTKVEKRTVEHEEAVVIDGNRQIVAASHGSIIGQALLSDAVVATEWIVAANMAWKDVTWHYLAATRDAEELVRYRKADAWLRHYSMHQARTLQWRVAKDASRVLMQPEVELSPNEVAACAIEILRNLALGDELNKWEYDFGPRGLRVSVRKAPRMMRPVSAQEYFDFKENMGFAQSVDEPEMFVQ